VDWVRTAQYINRWWVCGRLLAEIAGSNPTGGHGRLSIVTVVCCQVEVSASGWSLVQRSPTECGVSECDIEASIMRRPWPTRGCCAKRGGSWFLMHTVMKLYFS
jgi:hypothetical protein